MSEHSGATDAGHAQGTYARVWTWLVSVAATVGLICTYTLWGWEGIVTGATLALIASVFATSAVWIGDGRGTAVRWGLRFFASGLLVTASIGLAAVFGVAGFCAVLLLAVSAPGLTALVRRRGSGLAAGAGPGGAEHSGQESSAVDLAVRARRELRAIDDRTLCRAWRDSFALLNDATSIEQRLSVARLREGYLDELQRRSPQGLAAWFASGPRASSNPLPFLSDQDSRAD